MPVEAKRRWARQGIGWLVASLLVGTGTALAMPQAAACAVARQMPLDRLDDDSLADRGLVASDRAAAISDHKQAMARVTATFGAPRARPVIIHLSQTDALWPVGYNRFGSTAFLPWRTCIVIGPAGRGVDVVTHELVHAEIAHRVGYWRRWTQVPVWFDEGAGMQVDERPAFEAEPKRSSTPDYLVRTKSRASSFFDVPHGQLRQNYRDAKTEVRRMLARAGRKIFYPRLAELRRGQRFDKVWSEDATTNAGRAASISTP